MLTNAFHVSVPSAQLPDPLGTRNRASVSRRSSFVGPDSAKSAARQAIPRLFQPGPQLAERLVDVAGAHQPGGRNGPSAHVAGVSTEPAARSALSCVAGPPNGSSADSQNLVSRGMPLPSTSPQSCGSEPKYEGNTSLRDLENGTAEAILNKIKHLLPNENSTGILELANAYAAVVVTAPGPKPAGPRVGTVR